MAIINSSRRITQTTNSTSTKLDVKVIFTSKSGGTGVPYSFDVAVVNPTPISTLTTNSLTAMVEDKFKKIIKISNGNEWQSHFSWFANKKFPGLFKEMPPFAEDGGNDGWLPGHGIYFQCFGPFKPARTRIKELIEKMEKDTYKIIKHWTAKEAVKEYHFVWNNQFDDTIPEKSMKAINDTRVALMKRHSIKMDLITSESLLAAFRTLTFQQQLEFVGWDELGGLLTSLCKK